MKYRLSYKQLISSTLLILFLLLNYCCSNPVESSKKEEHIANAGEDKVSYVGSYVDMDASLTILPEGEKVSIINWIADTTNNPEKVFISPTNSLTEKTYAAFCKEGVYKFTMSIECVSGKIYSDDLIITVKPQQVSLIEDPNLEIHIRYKLDYPIGDLTADKLLLIDTLSIAETPMNIKINNLGGIEYCTNVSCLLLGFQQISNLAPLSNLTKLEYLDLNQNYTVEDISPISNLANLKHLILFNNPIKDIHAVENLSNLIELNLNWTEVDDISPIANLHNLGIFTLMLEYQKIVNIDPLHNLTKLKELTLSHCEISDLTPLENLSELIFLYLEFNKITSITPICKMQKLIRLYLNENQIDDLTGFRNIKVRDILDLSDNQIKDISEMQYLPKLHLIGLYNNQVEDILPFVNNPNLTGNDVYIDLYNNPLNEKSLNEYIPALKARSVNVTYGNL